MSSARSTVVGQEVSTTWVERPFPTRQFLIIVALGTLGVIGYIPYATEIGLPPTIFLLQAVLLIGGALIGTRYARSVNLNVPLIEEFVSGSLSAERVIQHLTPMAGIGVLTGVGSVLYNFAVMRPLNLAASGTDIFASTDLPLYVELLGPALYGGLTEEVIFRFGIMTGIAFLLARFVWRSYESPRSERTIIWTAIVLTSIPFTLEHLIFYPVQTPGIVLGLFGSIGVLGVLFGWLYWKRGLEAAMTVHLLSNATYIIIVSQFF